MIVLLFELICLIIMQISLFCIDFLVGINVCLPVHCDRDFTYSAVTVITRDGYESDDILCYFCFPCLGFAVPLRAGNVLFFNPNQPHCVSSRYSKDDEIYVVSLYLKYQNISLNDNDIPLTDKMKNIHEAKAMDAM